MTKRILCQFVTLFLLGMGVGLCGSVLCAMGAILFLGYLLWHIRITWSQGFGRVAVVLTAVACLGLGFGRGTIYKGRQANIEALLQSTETISFQGELYKKEIQSERTIYYLQDVILQREGHRIKCPALLLYPDSDDDSIGTIIIGKAKVKPFQNRRNEGNFDQKSFYQSNGIFAQLEKPIIQKRLVPKWSLGQKLYDIKKNIGAVYATYLPAEESGIMTTIALGEKECLEQQAKDLFRMAGLSHILVISGLHISVVGMFLYGRLRKMGLGFVTAGGVSFALVLLYALMSGMGNSTLRAVVMYGVLLMGEVLGEAYDSLTALAFAAFVMTWINPLLLTNSGFFMSFGAVIGVVTVGKQLASVVGQMCLEGRNRRKGDVEHSEIVQIAETDKKSNRLEQLRESNGRSNGVNQISTMLGVQLVLLPLLAMYFYEVPLYSMLLNLLLLPFVGILLGAGLLGGILGLFAPLLARVLLTICHFLIYGYEWVADASLHLPGARQILGCPKIWQVILFYSILYVACYRWRRWKTFLGIAVAVLVLCITPHRGFEMDILDVGQGDAIYWQSEEGETFFVDGGSSDVKEAGKYRILPFLKYRGIRHVDYWFVSHTDEDHISGLLECMQQGYEIKHLVFSKYVVKDDNYEKLVAEANKCGVPISYITEGDVCLTKSMKITCLAPTAKDSRDSGICQDANAMSMVLLVEVEGDLKNSFRALLTGDLPEEQERRLPLARIGQVDLYKASHHGSNSSSAQEMLDAIKPTTTVISCALRNRYGHPGQEAINRMNAVGSSIIYTMKSGQIKIGPADIRQQVAEAGPIGPN